MTRHISPHNQISVPVLDQYGTPLTPTRPSRARNWLESGKARKRWLHGRFAVQLKDTKSEDCAIPDLTLNINPGVRTTGMAVTADLTAGSKVVSTVEVIHRGRQISDGMHSRASHRRNRRSRLRRRPARFQNRTRKPGWLPPSMQSVLSNILTNVRHLTELFPISAIIVETCKFDPRLLRDPGIQGKEYQTSERGKMQIREYVLQRDNRTCQYCGRTKGRMELDHIVPESRGGPYRTSNLVTACRKCNKDKDNKNIEDFLAKHPAKLTKILAQTRKSLASATHMNQLMPLLIAALQDFNLPLTETDAVTTAYTRKQLSIPKSHANDAACLGEPASIANIPAEITVIRAVGRGRRQMLTPASKYGTPRYVEGAAGEQGAYRSYCRLPKRVQKRTTMPGHKLRQRRAKNLTSGDLIRYRHPTDGPVTGYAVLEKRNTRASAAGRKSVKLADATLLKRNNGYRFDRAPNPPPQAK